MNLNFYLFILDQLIEEDIEGNLNSHFAQLQFQPNKLNIICLTPASNSSYQECEHANVSMRL